MKSLTSDPMGTLRLTLETPETEEDAQKLSGEAELRWDFNAWEEDNKDQ